jgi:DNA-binding CsgD family transcriptional regulator
MVVLSLMRREATGVFPPAEIALLKKAEPLVTRMTQHYLSGLSGRFDGQANARLRGGRKRGVDQIDVQPADAVWQNLNLTSRETAIVDLVLQGHSSESIGLKLNISTGTVKVHRRNVYRKLGISSQTQLLAIYLKAFGGLSERATP